MHRHHEPVSASERLSIFPNRHPNQPDMADEDMTPPYYSMQACCMSKKQTGNLMNVDISSKKYMMQ